VRTVEQNAKETKKIELVELEIFDFAKLQKIEGMCFPVE
jgi:hypothetical protein